MSDIEMKLVKYFCEDILEFRMRKPNKRYNDYNGEVTFCLEVGKNDVTGILLLGNGWVRVDHRDDNPGFLSPSTVLWCSL